MDYLINSWFSISQDMRSQIIIIITLLIPAFIVIFSNHRKIEIIIGSFVFIIPTCVDVFLTCSNPTEYCPDDYYELGIYIFAFFLGLIYCLFIKFIYLSIKNFFVRNR